MSVPETERLRALGVEHRHDARVEYVTEHKIRTPSECVCVCESGWVWQADAVREGARREERCGWLMLLMDLAQPRYNDHRPRRTTHLVG